MPYVGVYKLLHATISDSLENKQVNVINYGIFNFGKAKPLNRIYFIPENFIENALVFTQYYYFALKIGELKKSGFDLSFDVNDNRHSYIFKTLSDTLSRVNNPKTFAYIHLLMPHAPFKYSSEFPYRIKPNLENYTAFWNFTNDKLEKLFKDLCKGNKYKIILTGDHGFRKDKRINFHNTFTAFYGFDQSEIDSLKSVQDLGSLINASF